MRRREFITLLGGAAAAWPLAARAQQSADAGDRFLHAGIDPECSSRIVAHSCSGLSECGLVEGRNVRIEYRWADRRYDATAGAGGRFGRRSGRP